MKKSLLYLTFFILPAILATTGCREDDLTVSSPFYETEGAIKVGASIRTAYASRAYIEDGPVTSGTFTLYYPYYISWIDGTSAYGKFQFLYNYGEVNFGFAGEETTGFVNTGTPTSPRPLIWSPTNTNSSTDDGIIWYPNRTTGSPVFLDNVPFVRTPTSASNITPTATQLRDSVLSLDKLPGGNPFVPGVFDNINGTNDLLWGTTTTLSGADMINIPMSHRMTRLILNVNVDNSAGSGLDIDLRNATVSITGLLLEPKTYLRKYGELRFESKISENPPTLQSSIPEELYSTEFYLVGSNPDLEPVENAPQWAVAPPELLEEMQLYTTQDFVFVPQRLRQGSETRPRLHITVPASDVNKGINGDQYAGQDYITFSGNIPYTMTLINDDGTESLQTLDFMKGQVIRLTTQMKPGAMELEFAPVTVEPWVWKGTFNPEAKQAGIFNAQDFYDLIKVYNDNNTFWIGRYGFIAAADATSGTWTFQFNSGNVELEIEKIMGMMHPGQEVTDPDGQTSSTPPFKFDFRGRLQAYVLPNGKVVDMATNDGPLLYTIVTASRNTGVTGESGSTFNDLISAYQGNTWRQLIFGTYTHTNSDGSPIEDDAQITPGPGYWTFNITNPLTLDYNAIVASMIPSEDDDLSDFNFNIENGVTITVNNYPGTGTLLVTAANAGQLKQIVTTDMPGIYTAEDFTSLINQYSTGELNRFGTKTGNTWTFPIWRNLSLTSANIQGAMAATATNPYVFNLQNHTVSLNQYDNTTFTGTTAQNLYDLLNLNEFNGISSVQDFENMIQTYNSSTGAIPALGTYGYYCLGSPRWVFVLQSRITLVKSDIEGTMVSENGKLPYKFDFNKQIVYLIDDDPENPIQLFGSDGENTLLEILSGNEP